ncbi:hypothetical protein [Vogesella indigofera]|uniref:Uncharacterized protein n=1 Tax=Vogesella indigofera TaxID=45465 RepID=A0ABT5I0D4_VOGIN|nr:hypothetical protein [Vogesella indigofera]MDC7689613.1 hypothetical protein [Vogesella indigofera]
MLLDAELAKPNANRELMTKGWPQAVTGFAANLVLSGVSAARMFLAAAFRAAAGYFLLLRQKKVPKEKATRRYKNSRENCHHPGAAHPLR